MRLLSPGIEADMYSSNRLDDNGGNVSGRQELHSSSKPDDSCDASSCYEDSCTESIARDSPATNHNRDVRSSSSRSSVNLRSSSVALASGCGGIGGTAAGILCTARVPQPRRLEPLRRLGLPLMEARPPPLAAHRRLLPCPSRLPSRVLLQRHGACVALRMQPL